MASVTGVNCSLSPWPVNHSDILDALIPRWIDEDDFNSKVVWFSDWLVKKNLKVMIKALVSNKHTTLFATVTSAVNKNLIKN